MIYNLSTRSLCVSSVGDCLVAGWRRRALLLGGPNKLYNQHLVRNINGNDADDSVCNPKEKKQKMNTDTDCALEAAPNNGGLLKVICDLYPSGNEQTTAKSVVLLCRIDQSSEHNANGAENSVCYGRTNHHRILKRQERWFKS